MHFGKEGTYPLGKVWFDFVRGNYDYWLFAAVLSGVFGAFAILFGFAVQGLFEVVQSRGRPTVRDA